MQRFNFFSCHKTGPFLAATDGKQPILLISEEVVLFVSPCPLDMKAEGCTGQGLVGLLATDARIYRAPSEVNMGKERADGEIVGDRQYVQPRSSICTMSVRN